MKRSITTWTTTLATAALLGLPAAAIAKPQQPSTPPHEQQPAPQPQQPQPQPAPQPTQPPTEPQPTQPPTQPQPTQPQQPQPAPQPTQPPTEPQPTTPPPVTSQQPPAATTAADQNLSPEEHLRQAREAYTSIKATSIPARDRAQFTELRRHLTALENSTASGASAKMPSSAKSAKADNWGTEVAAIDRILTKLVGSDAGTAAGGTSTAGATGTAGSSRTASTAMIDDATRSKLMEIRTHITAYAAAKSGASSTPRSDAAATPNQASAAQSATPTEGETPRTGNYPAQSQQPKPAQTPQPNPAETPQPNAAQNMPAQPATSPQAAGMPKVDADAAHRELLAARDSLNQLTQLPAAAQLAGDTRTQVQQLIANFNELITNTTDWRTSYTKVEGTLNTVLGPDTGTATPAETPAPTNPATPGAVGTTGTAPQLDPAIRAKLVEMRTHLQEFAKASGGAAK